MISTQLPEGPWVDIAIDLLEIPGGNHLLVVIDYFSRWPEVISVPKTDAHNVWNPYSKRMDYQKA